MLHLVVKCFDLAAKNLWKLLLRASFHQESLLRKTPRIHIIILLILAELMVHAARKLSSNATLLRNHELNFEVLSEGLGTFLGIWKVGSGVSRSCCRVEEICLSIPYWSNATQNFLINDAFQVTWNESLADVGCLLIRPDSALVH